jgi:hypothetical protein
VTLGLSLEPTMEGGADAQGKLGDGRAEHGNDIYVISE